VSPAVGRILEGQVVTGTVYDGKVAIVTGAGRGIGRAVTERLSADGATVVVNYAHSQGAARGLVDAIHDRGGRAAAVNADVGRVDQVRFLFAEVDRLFGRLDILFNNAAVTKAALLDEVGESLFDEMLAVNVKGALFVGQEAARRLGPGGRIVNISSSTTLFAISMGLAISTVFSKVATSRSSLTTPRGYPP
jgi:3-oxoacyl-[acyl-carrier protein] reductase